MFNSETSSSTNISFRSNLHNLTVEKLPKLCLNPFDDKRLYINPIQSLPWDKHTQKGDCPCIYCLKLIGLYYKNLTNYDVYLFMTIYLNFLFILFIFIYIYLYYDDYLTK